MSVSSLSVCITVFAFYSFAGWIVEVIYRSIEHRRFVNAGFLHGPFVPIYGSGALLIILIDSAMVSFNVFIKSAVYFFALSAMEYITGYLCEKIFRLKLWDYSGNRFNINGRVCLLYSFYWTSAALLFTSFIHPAVSDILLSAGYSLTAGFSVIFILYFTADLIFSLTSAVSFREKISILYREYLNLDVPEFDRIMNSIKRLYRAFPYLSNYLKRNIDFNIKEQLDVFIENVQSRVINSLSGLKPVETEYLESIDEILKNDEFRKLNNYFHHNSSIYDHVLNVSYFSYMICKILKLDYISAARGALLHDFFLYDWRNHDLPELAKNKNHGLEHPKIALSNAEKHFRLNDIERDIIMRHMWPLTLYPPRHRESVVVTFVDKYVSSKEFIDAFKKKLNRKT